MSKTNIEWTERVWNPFAGCSIVSPGCTNCYAMKMARRIEACNAGLRQGHGGSPHYAGTTKIVNGNAVWTGKIGVASDEVLTAPLRRKKPTTYFVNSMSDLFHESVPDEWIDKVFAVMALTPQHTYQVPTKRSARMREWFTADRADCVGLAMLTIVDRIPHGHRRVPWPLPNVWLGVSTERQKEADERIPDLLATPAAVRFISAEPLLGPIVLDDVCDGHKFMDFLRGNWWHDCDPPHIERGHPKLDWIIVGGESGPDARPMHPDWARSLRDQCEAARVPFFFKQWGEYREFDTGSPAIEEVDADSEQADSVLPLAVRPSWISADGRHFRRRCDLPEGLPCRLIEGVGKKAAGRLLDGVEHDAMPEAAR